MEKPAISVITAVYNGADHLDQCLASIEAQSFQDYEHIIVDDGSTDATAGILERWQKKDPRIRIMRNKVNMGRANARNRALACARGSFLAILDADDYSLPERLASQYAYFIANPATQILGGDMLVHGTGELLQHPEDNEAIRAQLFFDSGLLHSTVMMRKSHLQRMKAWYDPELPLAQDYGLWAALMFKPDTVFANIRQPLTWYRLSETPRPGYKRKQWKFANIVRSRILAAIGIRADSRILAIHNALLYGNAVIFQATPDECAAHARQLLECNSRAPIVSQGALEKRIEMGLERIRRGLA